MCKDCGETKPVADFGKQKRNQDGLRPYCRPCVSIRNKATAAKRDRSEYDRRYRAANKDRYRQYAQNWAAANPERRRELVAQYRARKLAAVVDDVTTADVLAVHGRWCYLCESPIGDDLHLDHVVPLVRGGAHSFANLRPTHQHCNQSKKDRELHELDLPFVPPHLKAVA